MCYVSFDQGLMKIFCLFSFWVWVGPKSFIHLRSFCISKEGCRGSFSFLLRSYIGNHAWLPSFCLLELKVIPYWCPLGNIHRRIACTERRFASDYTGDSNSPFLIGFIMPEKDYNPTVTMVPYQPPDNTSSKQIVLKLLSS